MMGAPLRAVQYVEPYDRIPALFSVTVLGESPHGKRIASVLLATVGVGAVAPAGARPAARPTPRGWPAPKPPPRLFSPPPPHRPGRVVAQGCGRHPVPRGGRRRAGRAPGVLPVLQAGLLPRSPAGDLCAMAGRHGLSWRPAGRDRGHAVVCPFAPAALAAGGRFRRTLRSHRAGS